MKERKEERKRKREKQWLVLTEIGSTTNVDDPCPEMEYLTSPNSPESKSSARNIRKSLEPVDSFT